MVSRRMKRMKVPEKVYADLHGKISTQWDMPRSGTKTATQCLKALVPPRMGRSRKMFDNSSDIDQRLDLFTLFTASQICWIALCFRSFDIRWGNVVGFASDNCNVMVGARNSVLSRVQERQPAVFNIGCRSTPDAVAIWQICVCRPVWRHCPCPCPTSFWMSTSTLTTGYCTLFSSSNRFAVLFGVYRLCMDWPILQLFLL